ncbi:hypothetical protein AMK16_27065 [Streptomyces sp. CB00455]|nr:hypothetical protein AMK16_27065 [Streptomyces sp. CB00455]
MLNLRNTALLNSHHAHFATMLLASAACEGSTVKLRLTSAGHFAPLTVHTDGTVEGTATAARSSGPCRSSPPKPPS